jgi:hypothetical protein
VSLPASIDDSVNRIRDVVELLRGHLQGARHLRMPEECIRELTGASLRLGVISAECTRIQSDMAAARMTGQAEWKSVPAEDLELHPVNLRPEPQEELMLASLHRVGDHTLDREEDA